MAPRPLVIAHRGASAERPENTLAAFRRALSVGAHGMELDVHVTRDGTAVVFHDDNLKRLTGVAGRTDAATWRELRKLRVAGREPIPRLTDVLRLTCGRAIVQIEIKTGVPVAPVVRAVRAAKAAEWVILASFSEKIVRDAGRLAPTVPRMLISEGRRSPAALARQLASLGACGISVNRRAIRSAAFVRFFHTRGFSVWTWTVNAEADMRRLAGYGVDALLGDDPALISWTIRPGAAPGP